jgi:hypothetical protein
MQKTRPLPKILLSQLSILLALLSVSCGSALDIGDGKGGDCQPCNANRVCDAGLSCFAFTGGKELCAKPSTKSCTTANGNGEPQSILSTLKIPTNLYASLLNVGTK